MSTFTVMLAEDEALIALDMVDCLRERGINVVGPCMSLDDCLNCIDGPHRIDAAILDVDLAGQDVFPAALKLKKRGIPFVFHSGHCTADTLPPELAGVKLYEKPAGIGKIADNLSAIAA
ncbi:MULTISPECIES: response regulator [Novosphingopyxis]|uniref:response regulator n=1 Tax=Novosphingopyxis TaxID=2709686 RepID=UPI000C4C5CB8|nr:MULTISPECIES: response regulator [Novosphingopyxis]MAC12243.1 response regulator [Sphingorhabdus sp.]MBH9536466.1 response regulator [Novosphingopyxis sp. YJ-S2-01]|tara:strand:+ start:131 stop:487 length:357 start_codon:yes stop_codon:yes gene_type:complete